jgi:ATP adenylyltransferase
MEEFPKKEIEALWAPWRVEYFRLQPRPMDFLTQAAQTSDDAAHFVVCRRKNIFLMMNRYPYAAGHLMAVPYRRVAEVGDLTQEEKIELWDMAALAQKILREVVRAQGFNIGLNCGKAGGAGVAEHLHLHVVPRWEGDSNFMPVVAGVRVLAEALDPLYRKLAAAAATA